MKTIRIVAVLLVTLAAFAGCKARDNNTTSPPATTSQYNTTSEDVFDREEDRLESDATGGIKNDTSLPEDIFDESRPDDDFYDENSPEAFDRDLGEESVVSAMSTDFSQIGALDAEKKGWGPGGPTDAQGRPDGATLYQKQYGQYDAFFIAPAEGNQIYLTFDEGYENGYTPSILDTLKAKGVSAVFFITLDYAKSQPAMVQRMIDEGHIVGNHSCAHKSFPEMPLAEAAEDIMKLHSYVKDNFGVEMTLFRPPMGEFNEQTLALTQSLGYKSAFWSFAYRDWLVDEQPLTAEALSQAVGKAHPGAIYLLHAVSQTNAEILGEFIDVMQGKGYRFAAWNL